jgi:hypothetical protein
MEGYGKGQGQVRIVGGIKKKRKLLSLFFLLLSFLLDIFYPPALAFFILLQISLECYY